MKGILTGIVFLAAGAATGLSQADAMRPGPSVHKNICPKDEAKRGPGDPTWPKQIYEGPRRGSPSPANPSGIAHLCLEITVEPDGRVSDVKTIAADDPEFAAKYALDLRANVRHEPSRMPDGTAVRNTYRSGITVTGQTLEEKERRRAESMAEMEAWHAEIRRRREATWPPKSAIASRPPLSQAEIDAENAEYDRREKERQAADTLARLSAPLRKPAPPTLPLTVTDCEGDGPFAAAIASCPSRAVANNTSWFHVRRMCAKLGARTEPDCSGADPELLGRAVEARDVESVEWLVARGMRRKPGQPQSWHTIQRCTEDGARFDADYCESLLRAMLRAGWNLNEVRPNSEALIGANATMTWLMLKNGADPNLGGEECRSVLDMARERKLSTVSLLEHYGARPRNPIVKADCAVSAKIQNVVRDISFILFFPGAH